MNSRATIAVALLALIVLIAALPSACRGKSAPSSSATPTSEPSTAASSPTGSATPGLPFPLAVGAIPPVVAQVISAVTAKQANDLVALVQYQEIGCTSALGVGGPPKCKAGDAQGTKYRVFRTGRCEPEWVTDATAVISDLVAKSGPLYAATKVVAPNPDPDPSFPKGQSMIYFRGTGGEPGTYFILGADKVVGAHRVCDLQGPSEADRMMKQLGSTEYLIPPSIR